MRFLSPQQAQARYEARQKRKATQLPDIADRDRLATEQLSNGIVDPNVREFDEDFPGTDVLSESSYRDVEIKTLDELEVMLKAIDERFYNSLTPRQTSLMAQQAIIKAAYHQRYLERKLGKEMPKLWEYGDPDQSGEPSGA